METLHHEFLLEEALREPLDFPDGGDIDEIFDIDIRQPNLADIIARDLPVKQVLSPEDATAARLRQYPAMLDDFIKQHDFSWGHQAWLDLLNDLSRQGVTPFNPDQIGLLLETRREELRQK